MLIGPNPELTITRANEVAKLARRHLRAAAGDRRDEVVDTGAGRLELPPDLFALLDDVDEPGFELEELEVHEATRADLDALAGFAPAQAVADTRDAERQARDAERIEREAQAQRDAEAAHVAATAAAQVEPVDEPADETGGTVQAEAAPPAKPAPAPKSSSSAKPKGKAKAKPAPVDFADRSVFPNIDTLVDFATTNGHTDAIAGLTKRGDLEAALTTAHTTK